MSDRRKELQQRLNKVFQETFDDEDIQISDEMTADDLEDWDSLMHITLTVAAETEFGMRLNINEVGNLKDVGELIDIIVERATK